MEQEKYVKYPQIPFLASTPEILDNPDVQVFEKLDGGNAQIRKVNYRVLCGSRGHYLSDRNLGRALWSPVFLHWAMANKSLYNLPEDMVVFGEWLAKHTLEYKLENKDKFYLLDVLDLKTRKFLDYDLAKDLVEKYELKDVHILPTLLKGKVSFDDIKEVIKKSNYGEGASEGVVVKHYPSQKFAKLWTSTTIGDTKDLFPDCLEQAFFSILDSGKLLNKSSILKEITENLEGQKIDYDRVKLSEFVNKNYFSLIAKSKHNH